MGSPRDNILQGLSVLHQDAMKGTQARKEHALKKGSRGLQGIQFNATQLGPVDAPYGDARQPRNHYTLLPCLRQAAQELPFIIRRSFLSEEAGSPLTISYRPKITHPRAKPFQVRNDRHTFDLLQANLQA